MVSLIFIFLYDPKEEWQLYFLNDNLLAEPVFTSDKKINSYDFISRTWDLVLTLSQLQNYILLLRFNISPGFT